MITFHFDISVNIIMVLQLAFHVLNFFPGEGGGWRVREEGRELVKPL